MTLYCRLHSTDLLDPAVSGVPAPAPRLPSTEKRPAVIVAGHRGTEIADPSPMNDARSRGHDTCQAPDLRSPNRPARRSSCFPDSPEEHAMVTRAWIAAITASILACGGSRKQPSPSPSEAPAHGEMTGMGCPAAVPGTEVSVENTPDGVALSFTSTNDVAEVRRRTRAMAAMHEHMMESGGMMEPGEMMMVPSSARAEEIDGGARIVLTPTDPAQLAALRAHVHAHANQMASGHCRMMKHHG